MECLQKKRTRKGGANMGSGEGCSHNCETCGENCSERTKESMIEKSHAKSNIKKVIGVVSGKGGVGKSIVTSMLAVAAKRAGLKTAIMDADITGPSIPRAFGVSGQADADDEGMYPIESKSGIPMISLNLLIDDETTPVIWRGPIIAGVVKQFWTDVIWGDVDVMFVDMPPGTGDVPLTVFQSIPVDGIIVVSTPQQLVQMIVEKAVNMAQMMDIPVLALVENMSYVECPDCGKKINLFGESRADVIAKMHDIPVVAKLPMNPDLCSKCDDGEIESFEGDWLNEILEVIENC